MTLVKYKQNETVALLAVRRALEVFCSHCGTFQVGELQIHNV